MQTNKTILKNVTVGAALLTGGVWVSAPAQAQISVIFNNTRTVTTSLGTTQVLDVERGSAPIGMAATMLTTLNVTIVVDPGYEFQGFNALTFPTNDTNFSLNSSDVTQDAAFSSAVNSGINNPTIPFTYTGPLLDFQVRAALPTGLYYKYALSDPNTFSRSFVRFNAINRTTGANATTTMFYGANVNEAGALAAAPEPGSAALLLGALPVIGLVVRRRRAKA